MYWPPSPNPLPNGDPFKKPFPSTRGSRRLLDTRSSLIDQIGDEIARWVISGEFQVGAPLPSQDELARTLGVSRGSLREALRRLEALGVVKAKHGKGTYLTTSRLIASGPASERPLESSIAAQLLLTLYQVEPAVAFLAAINATEAESADLAGCVERVREAGEKGDVEALLGHNRLFHLLIGSISRNWTLAGLVEDAFTRLEDSAIRPLVTLPADLASCIDHHQQVTAAICEHDPIAAYRAMEADIDHLLGHNAHLVQLWAGTSENGDQSIAIVSRTCPELVPSTRGEASDDREN